MKKNDNFESKLEGLEQIIKKIESDSISLTESIEEFEKGVELYKSCKDYLNNAEKKIEKISSILKEN